MRTMRGQSMAEFAAGVAMIGLLVLGTITIVSLQEIQRRQIMAAREAAFQRVWQRGRTGDESLRLQLARQHFDDPALQNPTGTARLLTPADIELTATTSGAPGRGAAAVDFLLAPLRAGGRFMGGAFDLADQGFHAGVIRAQLRDTQKLPVPFRGMELRFDQNYALLGDEWSASGPAHAGRRAGGLVPSHLLRPLSNVWRPLSAPLALFEPSLRELCFGLLEPDRVPEDRLGPGPVQGPPSCS